ncbi:hypothetical protein NEUTE2DRAFT_120506, partial [Neurospora tetrasperma FGSC 2509]
EAGEEGGALGVTPTPYLRRKVYPVHERAGSGNDIIIHSRNLKTPTSQGNYDTPRPTQDPSKVVRSCHAGDVGPTTR